MKKLKILSLGALIACSALLSSCEKESNNIVPIAATQSNDAKEHPIFTPVDGHYDHYPIITGSTCGRMPMILTRNQITGAGNIETWQSASVDASGTYILGTIDTRCAPVEANNVFPYVLDKVVPMTLAGVLTDVHTHTVWEADGTVTMRANVNLKRTTAL